MDGTARGAARRLKGLRAALRAVSFIPLVAVALPHAARAQSVVENRATAFYRDANGNAGTAEGAVSVVVGRPFGVQLTKLVDRATASQGDTLFFTLRWFNATADAVPTFAITDSLPSSLEFISGSVTSSVSIQTTLFGNTLQFGLAGLAPGDTGSVRFGARVTGSTGTIANVANATTGGAGGPGSTVHSDTTHTVITQLPAQLVVRKTVDSAAARMGDTITYVLHWRNIALGHARNISVTDVLPPSIELISSSIISGAGVRADVAGGTLRFDVGDLAPGDSANISFRAIIRDRSGVVENVAFADYLSQGTGASAQSDTARTMIRVDTAPVSPAIIVLNKTVDRNATVFNDTLAYTLHWKNTGAGEATSLRLVDSIPQGLTFLPGTVTSSTGSVTTEQHDGIATFIIGSALPGDSGVVRFGALVTTHSGTIRNHASAAFMTKGEPVTSSSDTASTVVSEDPAMRLELEALTDRALRLGDSLTFRIRVTNTSAHLNLRNIQISDSLPQALEFVSATPPNTAGAIGTAARPALRMDMPVGSVPEWHFPVLAPGTTIEIFVHTRVISVQESQLVNTATARGVGVAAALAAVATVTTDDAFGIRIQKTATSLDAAAGDVVGFSIVVENTGNVQLKDVIVRDLPSRGYTVNRNNVTGASLEQDGDVLRFDAGSLPVGGRAVIRYTAAVSGARDQQLTNAAWAISSDGVRSDTSSVSVRVSASPLASRSIYGRVWLDENGDGRQQPNERAVSRALIWTSHGETVRADTLGRFNFPDLAPGRYTFRVDPLSLPAGYTDGEPMSVRLDGFTSPTVNFGIRHDPKAVVAQTDTLKRRKFVDGLFVPRPRIVSPADGDVIPTNRVFIRVEAEPNANMELFDNDSSIAKSRTLGDGGVEFLGVELKPGPHFLSARIDGTGDPQTVEIKVHVSGAPKSVVRADTTQLRAGQTQVLALRVRDEWNVPVSQKPSVTVALAGAQLLDADVDPSSTGVQLPVDDQGIVLVRMRGDSVGTARIDVRLDHEEVSLPLVMLPEIRPFTLIADGEVGVGASARSYASATARGALDDRTSVTLSYDSRRTHVQSFGGAYDPFDGARNTLPGDASERAVLGSATTPMSLRVERDRSWLLVGDVDTRSFGSPTSPGSYQRALPGVTAAWNQAGLAITGFGSLVGQQLVQKQVQGNGTSGPYRIGSEIRLGTDRIAIETRDRLNASRVLLRHELVRYTDYDIDAVSGSVLLRQPLASTDAAGNPMMLVVIAEQIGGASAFVGGMRAQVGLPMPTGHADSVQIGAGYIEDNSSLGGHRIMTADLRAASRIGGGRIELAHGEMQDSAGFAATASAWIGKRDGKNAALEFTRIGDGFVNPSNPRLVGGTQDLRLSAGAALGSGWTLGGAHSNQSFSLQNAERTSDNITVARAFAGQKIALDVGRLAESIQQDSTNVDYSSITSRLSWLPGRNSFWLESVQSIGSSSGKRPSTYAIGAGYDLGFGIRAEASERLIRSDSGSTGLTTIGLKSNFATGTRAWTEYQLASSVAGQTSAALVGIGQKLRVSSNVSLDAQYEKRAGLSRLPETDPNRALPFARQEPDHWAASLGMEWTPTAIAARIGLRGEISESAMSGSGWRVFGSGEAALTPSLAILAREDARLSHNVLNTGPVRSQSTQSILAAALRPAARSDWNALFKIELHNETNPLTATSESAARNDRIIGAIETIWTPRGSTELSMRYAMRHANVVGAFGDAQEITSNTEHVGARVRQTVTGRFDVRTTGRLLVEHGSGMTRWDLAPAVGISVVRGLDLETGYRFGDLKDVDFAQNGGHGFYASLGMSLTENTGRSIAEFWRNRIAGGR